jgi:hypothetical protein
MCSICDGKSWEEALADIGRIIRRYGWMLQMVEASPPWTYTIGLAEFDHPELLLFAPLDSGGRVLNALGERVRRGAGFASGDVVSVLGRTYALRELQRGAWPELVGMWHNYYATQPSAPHLSVLQLIPGDERHPDRRARAHITTGHAAARHRAVARPRRLELL